MFNLSGFRIPLKSGIRNSVVIPARNHVRRSETVGSHICVGRSQGGTATYTKTVLCDCRGRIHAAQVSRDPSPAGTDTGMTVNPVVLSPLSVGAVREPPLRYPCPANHNEGAGADLCVRPRHTSPGSTHRWQTYMSDPIEHSRPMKTRRLIRSTPSLFAVVEKPLKGKMPAAHSPP